MQKGYLKVVCESVSFDKEIHVDKNCSNLEEALDIMEKHPELFRPSMTWILYPMSIELKKN